MSTGGGFERVPGGLLQDDVERGEDLAKALRQATGSAQSYGNKIDDADEAAVKGLVALVDERYKEAKEAHWELRKKCDLNDEFFLDYQQAAWNPNTKSVQREPRSSFLNKRRATNAVPRTQFNIFKPIIQTAVARFLSTHPQVIVHAGSLDPESIEGARVAQRVVGQHEWGQQHMEEVLAEAMPCLMLHGTTVLKVEWDPRAGRSLGEQPVYDLDADGELVQETGYQMDEMTGELTEGPAFEDDGVTQKFKVKTDPATGEPMSEESFEGKIVTTVVRAPDFFVDLTVTNFKDAMWCMQVSERSPAWVYDEYRRVVDAEGGSGDTSRSRVTIGGRSNSGPSRTVTVKEMWIRPGTYRYGPEPDQEFEFPRGYVVVVANGKVLSHGPNPYDHKQFPFVFIPNLRSPRELFGDTVANSLRIAQVTINKVCAQIQQANDLCANPQWLLPVDVKMPESDRVSGAGIHKRWEPQPHGQKPELQPGSGVAMSVFRYLDWVMNAVQIMSGQHEGGLMGGVPANIEAGVALEAIVERDTSRLATTAMEIGRGIKQWAVFTMRLWQQFKTEEETIAVTGRFMETEVIKFSGAMLNESMEPSVVPESTLPSSRAAKFQKAMSLFQMVDPKTGQPAISLRDLKRRLGEDSPDELSREQIEIGNARDENYQALKFGVIASKDEHILLDNPDIHLAEHDIALLSREFRENPEAYGSMFLHRLKHQAVIKQAKDQAMQEAMQQQQAMNGGQPGPGGPQAGPAPQQGSPPPVQEPGDGGMEVERPGIISPNMPY